MAQQPVTEADGAKFILRGCVVVIALGLMVGVFTSVVGCPRSRTGNPEVYARIDAMTDCAALQAESRQAEANFDRENAAGPSRSEYRKMALDYWEAADARIKQLGCGSAPR